jgi:hypothetical protein
MTAGLGKANKKRRKELAESVKAEEANLTR